MVTISELLEEIDRFLDRHGMSDTTFGVGAVNNSHLVSRLRHGKSVRRSSIIKIVKFMNRIDQMRRLEAL